MILYVVVRGQTRVEFNSLEKARAYAEYVGLNSDAVETVERELPKEPINSITARQLRLQAIFAGIALENIEAAIAQLPEPDKSLAKIEWEYATHFEREHPLVNTIGALLNLTETELDELWVSAAKL